MMSIILELLIFFYCKLYQFCLSVVILIQFKFLALLSSSFKSQEDRIEKWEEKGIDPKDSKDVTSVRHDNLKEREGRFLYSSTGVFLAFYGGGTCYTWW